MTISSIKGIAADAPARRTDGVVPGTLPALQRAERFQARLANAGGGYGHRTAGQPNDRVTNRRPDTSRPDMPKERGKTAGGLPAGRDGGTGKPGAAAAGEPAVRPTTVAVRRTQRSGKRRLRSLRKTVRTLAKEFELTVVDAWSDPAQKAVTVLVRQDGWADTQFVIQHDDTAWRVTVRTMSDREAALLRQHEKPLQRLFDKAELGRVRLSGS